MEATAHFILYVADQAASARFYERALCIRPRLDVPGMTEFLLAGGAVLGLMPSAGIKRLLGDALPDPDRAMGTPRAELYLLVDDPASRHARTLKAGARELSPLAPRDWGHEAAYCLDPDGHVLAFARALEDSGAKGVPGETMASEQPARREDAQAQGTASRAAADPKAGDDPYRPPLPLLDQPARTLPGSRRQRPWTVIVVIVLISLLGAMQLMNMVRSPIAGLVPTGLTALVLVGILYGHPWARILALVLGILGFVLPSIVAIGSLLTGPASQGFLGMALPALLMLLVFNLPLVLLLFTRSARRYFGATV